MESVDLSFKKMSMFDTLLNDRCDMYGVRNTISYLLDNDFTKADLLEMDFSEDDIDFAINYPDECCDFGGEDYEN